MTLPRLSHLYMGTERAQSVEITESIRAIYETSHVLDEQVGGTDWDEEQDNFRSLSSTGTPEKTRHSLMKTHQASIYSSVCIELFFDHIMNEHQNKIVELEKSKYTIGVA